MNLFGWNSFQSFPLVNGTKSAKFFPVSFPGDHTKPTCGGHFEEMYELKQGILYYKVQNNVDSVTVCSVYACKVF